MDRDELARIFPLGPDSLPQPDVPKGRVEKYAFNASRIYPGTERDYWIYVPAQYRASRPACLLVVQDGGQHLHGGRWAMATVLDNLIHQRAMPVTIGVFINPGQVPARRAGGAPRNNRSFEYDSADDRYARFLLEELLPEVEQRYRVRPDGNSRAIMGGSSGGHCALNVAWERPDRFQRVISMVGSFTNMRGGHTLAARVRLTEPKPLRVFLQGGAQDLDVAVGHWWTANLEMLAALRYAGYEVAHVWDERAGHNEFHCNMVCPDALRWIWQDWPRKPVAGRGSQQPIAKLLKPQKRWRETDLAGAKIGAMTGDDAGRLCFVDMAAGTLCQLDSTGKITRLGRRLHGAEAIAAGAAGEWYVALPAERSIVRLDRRGRRRVMATGVAAQSLCAAPDGGLYAADTTGNRVWLIRSDGTKRIVARVTAPVGLALMPDGSQLVIATADEADARTALVAKDGALECLEPYFWPAGSDGASAKTVVGLAVARPGWLVTATAAELRFNNSNGLLSGVMPAPAAPVTGMVLAGQRGEVLWIAGGGRLFHRKLRLLESLWC